MTKLEAARNLIQRGFEVFPIKEGAKSPPIKDFPNVAPYCADRAANWWGGSKASRNIGIHCRGLLVLDIDINKGGFDSLLQLELGYGLPDTLEFTTPSGGRHLVFLLNGNTVANTVGKLAPGIDVRSTNGYVVAPGSETPAGVYSISNDCDPIPAPPWLIAAAQQSSKKLTDSTQPKGNVNQEHACARAEDWLSKAPPAIEGQGGDAHTYSVVCRVRDLGVSPDNALGVLEQWNSRCEPPWDLDELQQKIDNAYRYAQNEYGSDSVEALFDVVQTPVASTSNEHSPFSNSEDEMYGPDDVSLESVLTTDYLIKGWLDRSSHALLFGHWGAGKTFIALHMAAHISADQAWFASRVKAGGVLYLGYEGAKSMRRRVYALRQEYPEWDFSAFRVRPMRWPLVRRNSEGAKLVGQQKLEHALQRFREQTGAYPALVIVDPLRNALGGSDSDPDLTEPYLAYMKKIVKVTGCAVVTVHHPGHGDADRGRGDSGIEAAMDTVIKVDGERGRIETRKQRDDPAATLYYRLKTVTVGEDVDGDPRTTCVVEAVDLNALDPTLTDQQQAVYDRLQAAAGADGKVTKTMFRNAAAGLSTPVRTEIFDTLLKKQYLVADGQHWRIGAGAAEMFA